MNASPQGSAGAKALSGHHFLQNLLDQRESLADLSTAWKDTLSPLREQAVARLSELSIPTQREEAWKYTDLSDLFAHEFHRSKLVDGQIPPGSDWVETRSSRLVFVNGHYHPHLSNRKGLPDPLIIGNLSELDPQLISPYLQGIAKEDVFTALNRASSRSGAVVIVPPGIEISDPIHLLFLSVPTDQPVLVQPRCWVIAGSSSSVTVLEEYVGSGLSLTTAVTEIWVERGARMNHTILQQQGSKSFHIAKTAVTQARDSQYHAHAITLGSQLSRHTLELTQTGEQAQTLLNGLTFISDHQQADTYSTITHQQPHGTSRQLHKCIVDQSGHAVFAGRIRVQQAAQLTNAAQTNRNLVLAPKARVDTQPQLEIFADNVKCAHGATVSQLQADEVFYLQSRGIEIKQARQLLTFAFAVEVIDHIPIASVQSFLRQQVMAQTQS